MGLSGGNRCSVVCRRSGAKQTSIKGNVDALYAIIHPFISVNQVAINALALEARLPTMHGLPEHVRSGGLMQVSAHHQYEDRTAPGHRRAGNAAGAGRQFRCGPGVRGVNPPERLRRKKSQGRPANERARKDYPSPGGVVVQICRDDSRVATEIQKLAVAKRTPTARMRAATDLVDQA